ncbi:MAG: 6-phosphofructokinase 1 [Thermoproteota archaeon]|nr:6-phosphofructokinase 1 [Thermoproteota archaeon]
MPATIDNDLAETDETIACDIVVTTAMSANDRIRDTALSYERVFVVETMGRDRGFLALEVGFAAVAGIILVPEIDLDSVCERFMCYEERGKATTIIVVAEGIGDTTAVVKCIEKNTPFETRLTKLGYTQRGDSPTARSRSLASLFGIHTVELLLSGAKRSMVAIYGTAIVHRDLEEVTKKRKDLDEKLYELAMEFAL